MRALALVFALFIAAPALAVNPSEVLDDPLLEERARELSKELRCLVCQNQSIDESDADLARDLRVLVRERLVEGDSNEEVLTYLTDRYGSFVRLTPPFNVGTFALWVLPFIVAGTAIIASGLYLRRRRALASGPADTLSAEEEAALSEILKDRTGR